MTTSEDRFVFDSKGRKTSVILSLKVYQRLMEELHDLAIVAERGSEKNISFGKMSADLRDEP